MYLYDGYGECYVMHIILRFNLLQSGKNILEYQNQAKLLFRKLNTLSPSRCSIETGPYLFQ